jgi:endonuclease YncB( thermonuclease family)
MRDAQEFPGRDSADVTSLRADKGLRTRRRLVRRLGLAFGIGGLAVAAAAASGLVELLSTALPRVWKSQPSAPPASAVRLESRLTGRAAVIDGDTIELQRERIRLFGIGAPESSQVCQDAGGRDYRCGQQAAMALADRIGMATVSCSKKDTDRYHRIVAVCQIGSTDLGAWLVSHGHAVAFRRYSDYVADEERGRAARRGMWVGRFAMTWDWRAGRS